MARPSIAVVFAGSGGAGAMTAGANYVARGFSGDPNGLADLIVDGIRWPGFAFIEVLSPCITFRPEQREWKKMVRPSAISVEQDRAAATALVLADDGFSMGVLYRGDRASIAPALKPEISIADVEREFALGAQSSTNCWRFVMKIRTLAASLAVAGMIALAPAHAQMMGPGGGPGGGGPGWGPGMMMGPGMMGGGRGGRAGMCDPRAAGMAEWRMERIERLIKPTDAQKTALEALRTASTKAAEQVAAACPKEFPANASARMEAMEKRMESMLAAIKTVRPAFDAFYATLTDEQKKNLDGRGPRGWGWQRWRDR